jgi:K+-transporting ATPase ATPase C chain
MNVYLQPLRPALVLFAGLTLVTGVAYPLLTTGIGHVLFPQQVAGSLVTDNGKTVGSRLIGQHFTEPQYFWGRPSATGPYPYNASASSGSNQGPLNPALVTAVSERIAALRQLDPNNNAAVPVDLVTASASGLDPDISPAAAYYQAARIASLRHLSLAQVNTLIATHTEGRQFGILGESRVNVLLLNLALDKLESTHGQPS